ncbi:unnamed protein product [Symbiodinium sp. CCMP2456]|nr:unnamed protein product [Symbiodinium sp. CCMP2456]
MAVTLCTCAVAALICQSGSTRLEAVNVQGLQKKYEHLDAWLFNGQPPRGGAAVSAEVPQAPQENMHDGNICADDEEYFEDLCYLKCSLATKGTHPIRTSAFTCCKSEPCSFDNTEINMSPCDGFDVSGNVHGQHSACPHGEGTCLEDEELLLGMCYKKCSILTHGRFNHRVAATTCCSETGLACFNPMNLKTDFVGFAVGGGKGDGSQATPSVPHLPMKAGGVPDRWTMQALRPCVRWRQR